MPGSKSKVSFRPNAVHSAVDCVTRLSLTKYFRDRRSRFVSQKYDKFPASFTDTYPFCKTTQGNLDVAIVKNSRNSHAILCYRFANFWQWLHLNKLAIAKKLSVKLAKNGRKNIWSVKVGCTLWLRYAMGHCISAEIELSAQQTASNQNESDLLHEMFWLL